MWDPETDACDYCKECDYFLHDYWSCQGELEPCLEFYPKKGSKYKRVEIEIINETKVFDKIEAKPNHETDNK